MADSLALDSLKERIDRGLADVFLEAVPDLESAKVYSARDGDIRDAIGLSLCPWPMPGYRSIWCGLCGKQEKALVTAHVSAQTLAGGIDIGHSETWICQGCNTNSRQRFAVELIREILRSGVLPDGDVWTGEPPSAITKWLSASGRTTISSCYHGDDVEPGTIIDSVRHESVTNLSFADESLALAVSLDVLEHVFDLTKAFLELRRVLKHGGMAVLTFPFHWSKGESVARAELVNGNVIHNLPPVYHADLTPEKAILAVTDIGWDVVDLIRGANLDVMILRYWSPLRGHHGLFRSAFLVRKR